MAVSIDSAAPKSLLESILARFDQQAIAGWVKDEAVKQGCERDTIQLDEWYTAESTGNVWHGTCVGRDSGERMTFAVNVDAVWTPSTGR